MRALAARAQQRQQHALAGIALARILRAGVEDQHVGACVRTSTEVPCPTSSASRSNWPSAGRSRGGSSSASASSGASARTRHGSGSTSSTAPTRPASCAHSGATGTDPDRARQVREPGQRGIEQLHDPGTDRPQRHERHTEQRQRRDHQRDQRDRDQVRREADDRDLLEEHQRQRRQAEGRDHLGAQVGVQRPPRRRGQPRQPAGGGGAESGASRVSPGDDAINRPTAMNDSQKPACIRAHGSSAVTTTAASSSTSSHGQRSPNVCSSVTVASIQTVRCDGTPQPENTA